MINVFIDFDGTITKGDLGDLFFEIFGGKAALQAVKDYRSGLINAVECFTREADAYVMSAKGEAAEFIDQQKIDPTFIDFVNFCNQHKDDEKQIKYFIVSDGLDYYIERILQNNSLQNIPYFSNRVTFIERDNHILTLSGDDDIIVYIGEGYSDFCPVKFADIVFAKDELQTHCQRENISYNLYKNFKDVIVRLEEILNKKRIRKRQQAEFNRKEILLAG
ncbi:MAG: HAD-IB family phosphatase [Bacteroidota bacterium]|nr:HAD-IB family phosphatase [Bacteroidota bacterium]